jgi:hypothetical protein
VCSVIQKLTEKLTHYTKGGEGAGEMNKTKGLSWARWSRFRRNKGLKRL